MNLVEQPDRSERARPSPSRERFERLYRTLRDRICLFEYPPGGRLSEEELALEFSISRTPVRRVLVRLEADGLIEARHGVGHIVTSVRLDELARIFHLRMELAVLIGRLSPIPRVEEDLDRIRALIARCDALASIPMAGFVPSYNLHAAIAAVAAERLRQIAVTGTTGRCS